MNLRQKNCNVAAMFIACLLQLLSCSAGSDYPGNLDTINSVDLMGTTDQVTVNSSAAINERPNSACLSFQDSRGVLSAPMDIQEFIDGKPIASSQTMNLNDEVMRIKISRINGADWNPEVITLQHSYPNTKAYYFPVNRRLNMGYDYGFGLYDAYLPQKDPFRAQRDWELGEIRKAYRYSVTYEDKDANIKIIQVKNLPPEEKFSHQFDAKMKEVIGLPSDPDLANYRKTQKEQEPKNVISYDDMRNIPKALGIEPPPLYSTDDFKNDEWFGWQRLQGANPGLLKRINEIPDKLKVTNDMMPTQLCGKSLNEALAADQIFMVDYEILKDIPRDLKITKVPAPIGLFCLKDDKLIPIAIQLLQEPTSDNPNPVFTPNIDSQTWQLAKLYFNLADSNHQEGVTHLGTMHLLIERIIIATHRQLSPSHPVFRLMKPHFLFTLNTNQGAIQHTKDSGDPNFYNFAVTGKGLFYLITLGIKNFNLTRDANVHETFKYLGTKKQYIKDYPYRDAMLKSYDAVRDYVREVLKVYYISDRDFSEDQEIQEWRKELTRSSDNIIATNDDIDESNSAPVGCGIQGVPGSDTAGFENVEQLIETVTDIIHTTTCRHNVINFIHYDYYGFPANSPTNLNGPIPSSADVTTTEEEVLKHFMSREQMSNLIIFTKHVNAKATNSVGDFEEPTLYQPEAVAAVKKFQNKIAALAAEFVPVNNTLFEQHRGFPWGDPSQSPNSIAA